MNDDLEICGMTRKTIKNLSQDSWSQDQVLKTGLLNMKQGFCVDAYSSYDYNKPVSD
jgi:hypothetical protein